MSVEYNSTCDYCGKAHESCYVVPKISKDKNFLINRSRVYVCNICAHDMIRSKELFKQDYNRYIFRRDATSQAKF